MTTDLMTTPATRSPIARYAPWSAAAAACLVAILVRQFLIQPVDIAHRCETATLTLFGPGPWWCSVRAAAIMTYAWNGLLYAAPLLSLATLAFRRRWLAVATLTVGLVAIVWYTYEAGAVAITIGALVLARRQVAPLRSTRWAQLPDRAPR